MNSILVSSHSGLRWILLIFLIITSITAVLAWIGKKPMTDGMRKTALFTMIAAHIQLVLGLILYFTSPKVQLGDMGATMKNAMLRFFAVEHLTMMLLAIILITIGYSKGKKLVGTEKGAKTLAIFFLLALVLLMVGIPWPPKYGAGWF